MNLLQDIYLYKCSNFITQNARLYLQISVHDQGTLLMYCMLSMVTNAYFPELEKLETGVLLWVCRVVTQWVSTSLSFQWHSELKPGKGGASELHATMTLVKPNTNNHL